MLNHKQSQIKYLWLMIFFSVLVWSAINPKDQLTWLLEVAPAIISVVILSVTYQSFRLTPILYGLILLHGIILMVGGHYTYAEVPWFNSFFGSERNNYDKVGHFFSRFCTCYIGKGNTDT